MQNKPALACTSWATVYARNFSVVGTVPEMAAALCVQVLAQSQRVLLSREQTQCLHTQATSSNTPQPHTSAAVTATATDRTPADQPAGMGTRVTLAPSAAPATALPPTCPAT